MGARFDNLEIGDQLELPAHRGAVIWGREDGKDPDRTVRVAIVTHIWHDPVEDKTFAGLAYLRSDGSYGKPVEKRTFRGLAMTGWRKASQDWIARLKAPEAQNVVNLWGRPG